jgi:predicted flavoprotein YhiN
MSARTIVVIGAGAAGLTAALRAAEAAAASGRGAAVTLLNAHPRPGLKILMSGGTRCNVTHAEVSERDFHGGSRAFVRRVLAAFPAERARAWLESLGVRLKLEPSGKYFPVSDEARTVLEALLGACERAGVAIETGARVVRIERGGEAAPRWRLGIQRVHDGAALGPAVTARGARPWPLPAIEPDEWRAADAVVLATGGLSFPRTGSDGTGYALAASLGHTIVPPVPALTPLTASDPLCERAQGLALEAALTLRAGGRRVATARGSLLFAHFGYSGPAALDLSRHWHRAEGEGDREVRASFVPGETGESVLAAWIAAAAEASLSVRRHLGRWLPERLVVELCVEAGVEPGARLGQVERARRAALLERVTARVMPVTGTLGYEKAEVTAGGVELSEVNPSTLESRKAPGAFLCGEILDVEGRLGGFNFQWAWSSGTVAGRASALALQQRIR